ncbi:hypothetical protein HDU67_006677 [Dinochytrium kinnereticum]|nr:hypothetical protein HDU67_006677 [Dinochytrium kinnereticum]
MSTLDIAGALKGSSGGDSMGSVRVVLDRSVAEILVTGQMVPPSLGWLPEYGDPMHGCDGDELPDYVSPPREVTENGYLSGKVALNLEKPMTNIQSITVRVVGVLEIDSFGIVNSRIGCETEPILRRVLSLNMELQRFSSTDVLPAGKHVYPFVAEIPGSSPSSTIVPYMTIKYTVDAVVSRHEQPPYVAPFESFSVIRLRQFDPPPGSEDGPRDSNHDGMQNTQDHDSTATTSTSFQTSPPTTPHSAVNGLGILRRRSPSFLTAPSLLASTRARRSRSVSPLRAIVQHFSEALSPVAFGGDLLGVPGSDRSSRNVTGNAPLTVSGEAPNQAESPTVGSILVTSPAERDNDTLEVINNPSPVVEISTSNATGSNDPHQKASVSEASSDSCDEGDLASSNSSNTTPSSESRVTTAADVPNYSNSPSRSRIRSSAESLFSVTTLDDAHLHVPHRSTFSGVTEDGAVMWECSLLPAVPADAKEVSVDLVLSVMRADTDFECGVKKLESIFACVREATMYRIVLIGRSTRARYPKKIPEERVRGKLSIKPKFAEIEPTDSSPICEDLRFHITIPINPTRSSSYAAQTSIYTSHTGKPLNLLPDLVEKEVDRHHHFRISVPYVLRKRQNADFGDWYQGIRRNKVLEILVPFKVVVLSKDGKFPWEMTPAQAPASIPREIPVPTDAVPSYEVAIASSPPLIQRSASSTAPQTIPAPSSMIRSLSHSGSGAWSTPRTSFSCSTPSLTFSEASPSERGSCDGLGLPEIRVEEVVEERKRVEIV